MSCHRSALDEFARWVAQRRPLDWVLSMLQYLAMSTTVRQELLWRFPKPESPEIAARQQEILHALLSAHPTVAQGLIDEGIEKGIEKGRLAEARAAIRNVLGRRRLALSSEDDARLEACVELATLERWLAQAVTAASASESLQ